ncbi:MAG TPA: type I DNA topoisomerase, partial [Chloroflexi bacterium]|nr:type I DNA topoisomerase [Chloroflexota bacterium]
DEARKAIEELERATYVVTKVKRREKRRHPAPPFITSTMQRAASNQLHFGARRTMVVAQQLYEGIELGEEGTVGLITYMRTDSVNVAASAQEEARAYIAEKHGQDYVPPKPRHYKTKVKGALEAHEAIRPTSVWREPWAVKKYLTRDQYLLYDLIWRRFVASQMASAIFDTTSVDIAAGPDYLFRATGSVVKFPGFLAVYRADEEEKEKALPPLSEGEVLDLVRLIPEQHFTQPPPRYTEASLIKALEEYGIGRPSTYAPIITTIQTRGYVEQVDRRLVPTELGFIVNDLLVEHFPEIMDVGFTAKMEEDLDAIARGERDWVPVLREFWGPFQRTLEQAKRNMPKVEVADQPTGEFCEKCGAPMVVKWGRYGKFIACSNFPECRNTKPYFEKIGVKCPECGGDLVVRKTRKGRTFYGCANYPECNFATWQRPLPEPCPYCGGLLTMVNKERAKCIKCGEVVKIMEIRETTEMRGRRG